ncbi:transcription factor bHLH61-like isoform X2 [Malania oleifera]|uniref:transcription factor bHLH61-like isoform X2 n=1 Tax=Malania oleifera TaxID=397392 RepID=UPI0025ADC8F0|nr:transcription factor bHLH61-like isoform X2 [Malania oleifera]
MPDPSPCSMLSLKNPTQRETESERQGEMEMELTQHGFFEELLALRRDAWNPFAAGVNEFVPTAAWNFDSFDENPVQGTPFSSLAGFSAPAEPAFECLFSEIYPFGADGLISPVPEINSSENYKDDSPPLIPIQEDYPSVVKDEELGPLSDDLLSFEDGNFSSRVEQEVQAPGIPVFNMGVCGERKTRVKKLEGQPSKNLMAERRRRKRLNDRLSMLRSIVPKISKMDRTSILGDTIDYMKELLERINKLQEEETEEGKNQMSIVGMCRAREMKPNEVMVRNSPKFDVERKNTDTRIEICCATKPGLLLSTVNTLEALGLEIQQCVISCFNDFSMQASCSEVAEQRAIFSSEDVKQALFRNAGYGGRCL